VRPSLVTTLLATPFVLGCYSYTRVQPAEVQAGVDMRARLSATTSDHVAPLLGATPRVLTGKLVAEGRDTVILEVPTLAQTTIGSTVQTLRQRVSLPKSGVIEWEIRRLDRPRTYALVGGATAIFAAILINALQGEPGSERLPGDGGVDARILLFRISR
jgi:hypothetical protein